MVLPKVDISTTSIVQIREEDELLIKSVAERNPNAFSEIYQKYHRQIYSYLRRIIQDENGAEDILQEVFLAVWQGAGKFRQKSTVKTWIYRIAYKQSISWLRKHRHFSNPINLDVIEDASASPEETAMFAIRNTQLKRAIEELTPKQRAVLELAFGQNMSYIEISEVLGCPIGTVKSRMSYALRNLNQILKKIGLDRGDHMGKEK